MTAALQRSDPPKGMYTSAINVWLTIVHGVTDTTAKDFHRSEKVFVGVPLTFRTRKFTLNRDQTKAILGTDGKLALTSGPKEFDHDLRPAPPARLSAR